MTNPYRPPAAACDRLPPPIATGIRRPWVVFLAVYLFSFLWYGYTELRPGKGPTAIPLLWQAVDLAAIVFLFRYVLRQAIGHLGVRLFVIALAVTTFARVPLMAFGGRKFLLPWVGDVVQFEFIGVLFLAGVFYTLAGTALWRYGTRAQH